MCICCMCSAWITLGNLYDVQQGESIYGEGFYGYLARVNVWGRALGVETEIVKQVDGRLYKLFHLSCFFEPMYHLCSLQCCVVFLFMQTLKHYLINSTNNDNFFWTVPIFEYYLVEV